VRPQRRTPPRQTSTIPRTGSFDEREHVGPLGRAPGPVKWRPMCKGIHGRGGPSQDAGCRYSDMQKWSAWTSPRSREMLCPRPSNDERRSVVAMAGSSTRRRFESLSARGLQGRRPRDTGRSLDLSSRLCARPVGAHRSGVESGRRTANTGGFVVFDETATSRTGSPLVGLPEGECSESASHRSVSRSERLTGFPPNTAQCAAYSVRSDRKPARSFLASGSSRRFAKPVPGAQRWRRSAQQEKRRLQEGHQTVR
jgi:hypothetical protein